MDLLRSGVMSKPLHHIQKINYGDGKALLFLWQKAFLMVPLWAIIAVPIIGYVCRCFGHLATEIGYGIALCLCLNYFFLDLLRRRIRMDDDYIFFGYRAIPIKTIVS